MDHDWSSNTLPNGWKWLNFANNPRLKTSTNHPVETERTQMEKIIADMLKNDQKIAYFDKKLR